VHRTLLLLCGLFLAALGLDVWQTAAQERGRASWFDSFICGAASPLQKGINGARRQIEGAWRVATANRELTGENKRLTGRVADLEREVRRLREAQRSSARERDLLRTYGAWERTARVARVIGVGEGGWLTYLVVDRGSADGTRPRDVALTAAGVLGQVYAVTPHTARVVPITHPVSGVAVRVERSREMGVLKGRNERECELRYLGPDADVRPGDEVLTAGTGGVFPKGLKVGRVTEVIPDPYTPGKVALVLPAARPARAEEVLLVRAGSQAS
jgi:rod shape-determining protein MreC